MAAVARRDLGPTTLAPPPRRDRGAIVGCSGRSMMRLTWSSRRTSCPTSSSPPSRRRRRRRLRERWIAAGGAPRRAPAGRRPRPPRPSCAPWRRLLALVDEREVPAGLRRARARRPRRHRPRSPPGLSPVSTEASLDRLHGAWLGRAAGCLLGKPVEKIPRAASGRSPATGRWPLDRYFTAVGLDPAVAARWPWNRRSRPTSLAENIDGMPEDDDLNYPLLAPRARSSGTAPAFTPDDVAQVVARRPARAGGCSRPSAWPTATCSDGDRAAADRDDPQPVPRVDRRPDPHRPLRLGQPRRPRRAAAAAWRDAGSATPRNGLYGAMFVAAVASAAVGEATSVRFSMWAQRRSARRAAWPVPSRSGATSAGAAATRRRRSPRWTRSTATCTGCTPQQRRARRLRPGGRRRGLRPVDLPRRHGRLGHRLQRRHGGRDQRCPGRCRRPAGRHGRRRCATG